MTERRRQREQGYLELEEKPLSGVFCTHFFHLNRHEKKFNYFRCHNIPKSVSGLQKPAGCIDVQYVSEVNCCRKSRPKIEYCFALTVAGEKVYLRANNQREKEEWMEVLKNMSKITVPKNEVIGNDRETDAVYETTVVGGVIVRKPLEEEESSSSCEELSHFYTHDNIIKSGYAVKQGAVMRSWKRRYFILDSTGLTYFKSDLDLVPLKIINKYEIIEARISRGVHPSRENLFEVVTEQRVFYIQTDSITEMNSWIDEINELVQRRKISTPVDAESQTSPSLAREYFKYPCKKGPAEKVSMSTWL